jgi:BirA family biotin operon repressor/biotin-[acetyl-CoA-carboxylase] ligase
MISTLAVACAVELVGGLKAEIKWPNDVLVNGKKICGIMIESGITGNLVNYAVIGIGLNVNMRMQEYPEIVSIATSLSDQAGKEISMVLIARTILEQLEKWYAAVLAGEPVFHTWRDRLVTLGKQVTVKAGNAEYSGVAESVDADGSLMIRQPDGSLVTVPVGDVTLRR